MFNKSNKYLLIQTASIGDVVLISPVIESIHNYEPQSDICILTNTRGAELFHKHPFIKDVFVWNKKKINIKIF